MFYTVEDYYCFFPVIRMCVYHYVILHFPPPAGTSPDFEGEETFQGDIGTADRAVFNTDSEHSNL